MSSMAAKGGGGGGGVSGGGLRGEGRRNKSLRADKWVVACADRKGRGPGKG